MPVLLLKSRSLRVIPSESCTGYSSSIVLTYFSTNGDLWRWVSVRGGPRDRRGSNLAMRTAQERAPAEQLGDYLIYEVAIRLLACRLAERNKRIGLVHNELNVLLLRSGFQGCLWWLESTEGQHAVAHCTPEEVWLRLVGVLRNRFQGKDGSTFSTT